MTLSLSLVTVTLAAVLTTAVSDKLLVILLDGFRWDYVEKYDLPNFKRFYNLGVTADGIKNEYPTLSFPNYYTLLSGLYTESHGITGNYMYDEKRKEYFLPGLNSEPLSSHWFDGGEPVWVTAERQRKSTYIFSLPGCEVTIRERRPTYCLPYIRTFALDVFQSSLNEAINLLGNGTADLAAVYCEQPDLFGHAFGPDSLELQQIVRGLDTVIGSVIDRLEDLECVNLIIFSDHGMTNLNMSKLINITGVLTSEPNLYVAIVESIALTTIYVENKRKEKKVFNLLKNFHPHMHVYRKADIPERYHYKRGPNAPDILCVADLGWTILQPFDNTVPKSVGYHGYDNQLKDMRGIFYALGPYFKSDVRIRDLHAVDIYNVMCSILDITPSANNGSLARIRSMRRKYQVA